MDITWTAEEFTFAFSTSVLRVIPLVFALLYGNCLLIKLVAEANLANFLKNK